MADGMWRSGTAHLITAKKQNTEGKDGPGSSGPPRAGPPATSPPPSRPHFLKLAPSQECVGWGPGLQRKVSRDTADPDQKLRPRFSSLSRSPAPGSPGHRSDQCLISGAPAQGWACVEGSTKMGLVGKGVSESQRPPTAQRGQAQPEEWSSARRQPRVHLKVLLFKRPLPSHHLPGAGVDPQCRWGPGGRR